MPKKWSEVTASPEFQKLSPDDQEAARNSYFEEVIKPQIPEEDHKTARAQFDADTAPKKSKKPDLLTDTVMTAGKQIRSGKQFVSDVLKSTNAAIVQSAGALGEMVEKPVAAGVNAAADALGYKPPMSGTRFSNLSETGRQLMPKDAPVANVVGETGALLAGGELAKGAQATKTAVEAARSLPGRLARAGVGGGAAAMATTPSDPQKPFAESKLEQGAEGAVLGTGLKLGHETLTAGANKLKEHVFGIQSDRARQLWDKAKSLGFRIRPDQTRADSAKVSQPGLTPEDKIANRAAGSRMVTEKAGEESTKITPAWFKERFDDLGAKFGQVYAPGTRLKIDKDAIDDLRSLVDEQEKKGVSSFMSQKAIQSASRLIAEWDAQAGRLPQTSGAKLKSVALPSEQLQELRGQLRESAAATNDGIKARAMHEVVNAIDGSVERNHPALASLLKEIRPQYQALATLEHGAQSGGFVDLNSGSVSLEGLGEYLRKSDRYVVRGSSRHPLAEAGELGEVFGIRGMNEASMSGNRWSGAGQEAFSPTRTGLWRLGLQQAKRGPGTAVHRDYLKFGATPQSRDVGPYSLAGALASRKDESSDR